MVRVALQVGLYLLRGGVYRCSLVAVVSPSRNSSQSAVLGQRLYFFVPGGKGKSVKQPYKKHALVRQHAAPRCINEKTDPIRRYVRHRIYPSHISLLPLPIFLEKHVGKLLILRSRRAEGGDLLSSTLSVSGSSLKCHSPPTYALLSKPVTRKPSSSRFLTVTRPMPPYPSSHSRVSLDNLLGRRIAIDDKSKTETPWGWSFMSERRKRKESKEAYPVPRRQLWASARL